MMLMIIIFMMTLMMMMMTIIETFIYTFGTDLFESHIFILGRIWRLSRHW